MRYTACGRNASVGIRPTRPSAPDGQDRHPLSAVGLAPGAATLGHRALGIPRSQRETCKYLSQTIQTL